MTSAEPARPAPGRSPSPRADSLVIVVVLALALGAMLLFAAGGRQELRRAPSGFDGLAIWLSAAGLDAQSFRGGWTIPADEVGLTVLPIYDAALDAPRAEPATERELLLQRDELDMDVDVLREKARLAQTLLVLPKWRSGMRLTGVAHPDLLIAASDLSAILGRVRAVPRDRAGAVRRVRAPFAAYDYLASDGRSLTARLYLAQTFDGTGCRPLIGEPGAMILGRCPMGGDDAEASVLVLSDPDLLDNHGLRLGDNAEIALDLARTLAAGKRVIVDYSDKTWFVAAKGYEHPARTWADLARFFAFPFSLLWLAAGATLALFVWRGGVRVGPVIDGASTLAATRAVRLGARARLMRLTGQDGALLQACAQARIASTAHALLGPRSPEPAEAAVLRVARTRNPALADRLADLLDRIRAVPADLPPEAAMTFLDELETLLERANDDA